nr:MAG TPA: hypothetical protein [Caudoviricetes sp.]
MPLLLLLRRRKPAQIGSERVFCFSGSWLKITLYRTGVRL